MTDWVKWVDFFVLCVVYRTALFLFVSNRLPALEMVETDPGENCKAHHGDCVHYTAWKLCEQLALWTLLERNNCLMLCLFYEYYHHHHHRHRQSYDSWIVCVCVSRKNPFFLSVDHHICNKRWARNMRCFSRLLQYLCKCGVLATQWSHLNSSLM